MKSRRLSRQIQRGWSIVRTQGMRRFAVSAISWLRSHSGNPSDLHDSYVQNKMSVDAAFDANFGVATGGVEYLYDLTIKGKNGRFGTNHVASDPQDFSSAISTLDIELSRAVFVDLGSGKGRALILAAQFPFLQIIGVEFAHELYETCTANIFAAQGQIAGVERISATLDDATKFEFPDRPLVLYLYNPFDAPVMAVVARNALASWRSNPRPMRVLYLNPIFGREWTDAGWQLVADGSGRAVFAPPLS